MSRQDVDAAVDGRLARIWAKEGTHLLLGIIAALVSFFWRGQSTDIRAVKDAQDEQKLQMSEMKSDIRSINDRLDAGLVRQIGELTRSRDDHESRIQRLERSVPVK